jgi:hypothetical protein
MNTDSKITVANPDTVEIGGRVFSIERVDFFGVMFYGCGLLPLRRNRKDLIADIERAQGLGLAEWDAAKRPMANGV